MSERGENKKEKETFRIEFSTKRRKKPNLTPITNRIGTSSTVTTLPLIFPNSLSFCFFRFSSSSTSQLSLSLSVLGLSACDFGNLSLVICVSPEREREWWRKLSCYSGAWLDLFSLFFNGGLSTSPLSSWTSGSSRSFFISLPANYCFLDSAFSFNFYCHIYIFFNVFVWFLHLVCVLIFSIWTVSVLWI